LPLKAQPVDALGAAAADAAAGGAGAGAGGLVFGSTSAALDVFRSELTGATLSLSHFRRAQLAILRVVCGDRFHDPRVEQRRDFNIILSKKGKFLQRNWIPGLQPLSDKSCVLNSFLNPLRTVGPKEVIRHLQHFHLIGAVVASVDEDVEVNTVTTVVGSPKGC
jgi:hypothetical protein